MNKATMMRIAFYGLAMYVFLVCSTYYGHGHRIKIDDIFGMSFMFWSMIFPFIVMLLLETKKDNAK